jgi:hypothetical protein
LGRDRLLILLLILLLNLPAVQIPMRKQLLLTWRILKWLTLVLLCLQLFLQLLLTLLGTISVDGFRTIIGLPGQSHNTCGGSAAG